MWNCRNVNKAWVKGCPFTERLSLAEEPKKRQPGKWRGLRRLVLTFTPVAC